MDKDAMSTVLEQKKTQNPFEKESDFYVLVEVATSSEDNEKDIERLMSFLETVEKDITDGIVAQD